MASITSDPNGRRRIQFIDGQGKRHAIRLGKMSHRQALAFKIKLEDLLGAVNSTHTPSDETQRWLIDLDDATHRKLSKVGLVQPRCTATLGGFIDAYIERRHDVKPSTRLVYHRVRKHLVDYFGADKQLRAINTGDADAWRSSMLKKGLGENTIRCSTGVARQWFTAPSVPN